MVHAMAILRIAAHQTKLILAVMKYWQKYRASAEYLPALSMQGQMGEDLSGGYYEAGGSYLKVGLPEAFSITQLAWTITRHRNALYRVGLLDEALSALQWSTDYLVRDTPGVHMCSVMLRSQ